MTDVRTELEARKKEFSRKETENNLLNRKIEGMEQEIIALVEEMGVAKEGLAFLEELANKRRGAMKGKIESVVSEALKLIYGDSYRIELSYSVKNNRSNLEIEMIRETTDGEVRRDMGGFGGGVADTISVPLRLMVLMGSKQTDRVCILDECWKHIDPWRIEQVGEFLKSLADKLGIQVVFCTHHQDLRAFADKTYDISETCGTSKVKTT